MAIWPKPQTIILTPDQCAAMLASEEVGRLVLAGGPAGTAPMSYGMDAGALILRVEAASSVARATGRWAQFEVDHYDKQAKAGWSVVARGVLEAQTGAGGDGPGAQRWAAGSDGEELRLQPRHLTGQLVLTEPLYPTYPLGPRLN